jgi:hypothetical protein
MRSRALIGGVVVACLVMGGCGGEAEPDREPGTPGEGPVESERAQRAEGEAGGGPARGGGRTDRGGQGPEAGVDPAEILEQREVRTLPNGTVIYVPSAPAETVVEPADECGETEVRQVDGARETVTVPPAPGVRAERAGQTVTVTLSPGRPPSECRPTFARVGADRRDDPHPAVWETVRLRGAETRRVTIDLPPQIAGADTVLAYSGSGRSTGPTSRIVVRPPGD